MLNACLTFQRAEIDAGESHASLSADHLGHLLGVHPDFGAVAPPFFPPPMVTPDADARFGSLVQQLARIFSGFLCRLFEQDGVDATLTALGYKSDERAMLADYCTSYWLNRNNVLLRFDFLSTPDGLRAVELNASPGIGGIGLIEAYDEGFGLSRHREWLVSQGLKMHCALPMDHVVQLIEQWAARSPQTGSPAAATGSSQSAQPLHVVLATLPNDLDYLQTAVCARYLQRPGLKVSVASVFELGVDPGGVSFQDQRVDFVWAVHAFEAEINDAPLRAQATALRQASKDGCVGYLLSPSASVLGNKALFSLLLGRPGRRLLDVGDRALVEQALPWTAIVTHDNVDELVERQDTLVLKPARGVSGRGILFGYQVGPAAWRLGLDRILASGVVYVAQRLSRSVPCDVPPGSFDSGGCTHVDMVLGGICVAGRYAGHFVRALPADSARPINITFGGRIAPCYVVHPAKKPGAS